LSIPGLLHYIDASLPFVDVHTNHVQQGGLASFGSDSIQSVLNNAA
jgi:hypothetical protein